MLHHFPSKWWRSLVTWLLFELIDPSSFLLEVEGWDPCKDIRAPKKKKTWPSPVALVQTTACWILLGFPPKAARVRLRVLQPNSR